MNRTSTLKHIFSEQAELNWKVIFIALITIAIIAFAAYSAVTAGENTADVKGAAFQTSSNPIGKIKTRDFLAANPEMKVLYSFRSNPYQRAQAEEQFAQRYNLSVWENPKLILASSDPTHRTHAELQFVQRYQAAVSLNPELKVLNLTSIDPHQRTRTELQFAQQYGK